MVQLGNSLKFPERFRNNELFRSYADAVFSVRRKAWDSTNRYLFQAGWIGLSEKAVNRKVPYMLQDVSGILAPELWIVANSLEVWLRPDPPVGTTKELDDYRYHRVAR